MKWRKLGLVFSPNRTGGWMNSHAQVPTPLLMEDRIRVYFSSRPERRVSLTSYVDLDLLNPCHVLYVHPSPILELGKPGTFDEHGVMPSCAIRHGRQVYLYYSGWSRSASVPYTNSSGLAISNDGGNTFSRISEGPILSKSLCDPYSATSPVVLKVDEKWHMWYCSGKGWLSINDKFEHIYDIKYACSSDGIHWTPTGIVAVKQQNDEEAITRPYVVLRPDGYHMWFCCRGSHDFRDGTESYRIGHAFSRDMQYWTRQDDVEGMDPLRGSWASKMVAYPAILPVGRRTLMFFNGNDFGADGFGYAELQEE